MFNFRRLPNFLFGSANHTIATATCIVAIVTTGYVVVSFLQWSVARGQWKAARIANEISAGNTYQIQRPFMFVLGIDPATKAQPAQSTFEIGFNPSIRNGGHTPAKNLKIYINYDIRNDKIPEDYRFADLRDVYKLEAVAGPESIVKVVPKYINIGELQAIQSGAKFGYIYGHIEYDDFFEKTRHHRSLFCFETSDIIIIPSANPTAANATITPPSAVSMGFPPCSHHNCTDDECNAQGF